MESNKGTSVTRFGYGPDDEDITIHFYEGQGRFEVKNKDIAGPMIFATDDLLEPEVPKGARLLVNEKKTKVDKNGCYVFRKTDGGAGFDIAIVEPARRRCLPLHIRQQEAGNPFRPFRTGTDRSSLGSADEGRNCRRRRGRGRQTCASERSQQKVQYVVSVLDGGVIGLLPLNQHTFHTGAT